MVAESGTILTDAPGAVADPAHDALTRVLGRRGMLRSLLGDKTARIGLVVVTLLVLVAALAPILAPHDPLALEGSRWRTSARSSGRSRARCGRRTA